MRINSQSPERLILTIENRLMGGVWLLIGPPFLLIGLFASPSDIEGRGWFIVGGAGMALVGLWMLFSRTRLDFHRADDMLRIRRRSIFGTEVEEVPLQPGLRLSVQGETGHAAGSTTALVLRIPAQPEDRRDVLTMYSRGRQDRKHMLAGAANRWLGVEDLSL